MKDGERGSVSSTGVTEVEIKVEARVSQSTSRNVTPTMGTNVDAGTMTDRGYGQVLWLRLDLSDPTQAKSAAKEFATKEKRLDILGACKSMCSLLCFFVLC